MKTRDRDKLLLRVFRLVRLAGRIDCRSATYKLYTIGESLVTEYRDSRFDSVATELNRLNLDT